jgi:hypothetical protein
MKVVVYAGCRLFALRSNVSQQKQHEQDDYDDSDQANAAVTVIDPEKQAA